MGFSMSSNGSDSRPTSIALTQAYCLSFLESSAEDILNVSTLMTFSILIQLTGIHSNHFGLHNHTKPNRMKYD
ncbi:hypothetical protein PanWU01x14_062520 [Parasponia andersonii]|uniref:Uncharacterized protein n=1 Tax=Parasponia andersonii TaxID=3476 RepID=A0A2P5DHP8_PARAD|nr:hypothetical protein PanWU01x14_062520 [Parasponia andersonii]